MTKLTHPMQVLQPGWSEACLPACRSALASSRSVYMLLFEPRRQSSPAPVYADVSHPVYVCCAVKQRMRSVQNIAKITSAMKMVAASKMRVAQTQTEKSRGMLTPFLTMLGDLPGVYSSKLAAFGMHGIAVPSIHEPLHDDNA